MCGGVLICAEEAQLVRRQKTGAVNAHDPRKPNRSTEFITYSSEPFHTHNLHQPLFPIAHGAATDRTFV
jgi:hypothetical protein